MVLSQGLQLHTPRLMIRRFKPSDLADEMTQQQDPEVVRYIREPLSDEEAVDYFQDSLKPYQGEEGEWLGLCVTLKEQQNHIGAISFRYELLAFAIVEIGYRFNPDFQGKGYAFEAVSSVIKFIFNHLSAHKIVARCDPRNESSYKLMEKLGMQREGLLRQHYRIGEQWTDELVYGLINPNETGSG